MVEHLAGAGLRPTIRMMRGMADFAATDAARISLADDLEAVRTTLFGHRAETHARPAQRPARPAIRDLWQTYALFWGLDPPAPPAQRSPEQESTGAMGRPLAAGLRGSAGRRNG
jgi:hypothetical protein